MEAICPIRAVRPAAGTPVALVAEDEPALRELLQSLLAARGYHVLAAPHGAGALRSAEAHGGRIDVLVSDLNMPRMCGAELAERLRAERPGLPVLFISALPEAQMAERVARIPQPCLVLSKPFRVAPLLSGIALLLEAGREAAVCSVA